MQSLIYLSAATKLFSNTDLLDILTVSRLKNTSLNITGLLIYHEGSIIQILEGDEMQLNLVFDSIKNDPRHKNIIKYGNFNIAERSFPDWSMGFKQISDENWKKLEGYLDLNEKEKFDWIKNSKNNQIIKLIKAFANTNSINSLNF